MKFQIDKGSICNVLIRGQRNTRRRVFKWTELRFGSIPCYVFSAPCRVDVKSEFNHATGELTIRGSRVPASEVSVPEYDILRCEAL